VRQVTIHMTSVEKHDQSIEEPDLDSSVNLTKTPTEDEINWLWTKVCVWEISISWQFLLLQSLIRESLVSDGS